MSPYCVALRPLAVGLGRAGGKRALAAEIRDIPDSVRRAVSFLPVEQQAARASLLSQWRQEDVRMCDRARAARALALVEPCEHCRSGIQHVALAGTIALREAAFVALLWQDDSMHLAVDSAGEIPRAADWSGPMSARRLAAECGFSWS